MVKFSFVILHYLDYEDTIECIESILGLSIDKYSVVINVIDNASFNDSYYLIKEKYKNNQRIRFVRNKTNLGFARGNNIGYRIAKNKDIADFVVILNSDTIVNDRLFLEKVEKSFVENQFYVMGPDIITINGIHQNPIESNFDYKKCKKLIRNATIMYLCEALGINALRRKIFKSRSVQNQCMKKKRSKVNAALHGAFLIYSSLYVNESDYAFYPKTYLYMEENILHYLCMVNGYKTYYDNSIEVLHKEDVSSKILLKNSRKRMMFTFKHQRKSAKEFAKLIQNNK